MTWGCRVDKIRDYDQPPGAPGGRGPGGPGRPRPAPRQSGGERRRRAHPGRDVRGGVAHDHQRPGGGVLPRQNYLQHERGGGARQPEPRELPATAYSTYLVQTTSVEEACSLDRALSRAQEREKERLRLNFNRVKKSFITWSSAATTTSSLPPWCRRPPGSPSGRTSEGCWRGPARRRRPGCDHATYLMTKKKILLIYARIL